MKVKSVNMLRKLNCFAVLPLAVHVAQANVGDCKQCKQGNAACTATFMCVW